MPCFTFQTRYPEALSTVTVGGVTVPALASGRYDEERQGSWLRRIGPDPERHDRSGALVPTGVVTTGAVPMSGLTEIFGVAIDAVWLRAGGAAADACTLQVSVDGGTTFLAWTGAAWEEQEADDVFNSATTFCDHCHEIALANPRSLAFRVLLTAAGDDTPLLRGVDACLEWVYDPTVDVFQITRDLLTGLRLPFVIQVQIAAAAIRVRPATRVVPDMTLPIRVFNVTADPLRNVDLFDSVDGADIVLSAQQAAGSLIQIEMSGSAPVHVAKQDEMLALTTVPSVLGRVGKITAARGDVGREYDFKRGDVLRRVRVRQRAALRNIPLSIEVLVAEPRTAALALEAMRDALSRDEIRSPASGLLVTLIEDDPGADVPVLAEGIESSRWSGRLQIQFPARQYDEYEGAREVRVDVGDRSRRWEQHRVR